MSDVESMVYDHVSSAARSAFPKLSTSSWWAAQPTKFPFAYIVQTDDYDVPRTLTSNHDGEGRHVTFEVDVYSDKAQGRKAEAKAISRHIAAVFKAMGFVQTLGGRPIDLSDEKNRHLARYKARYEAVWQGGVFHDI